MPLNRVIEALRQHLTPMKEAVARDLEMLQAHRQRKALAMNQLQSGSNPSTAALTAKKPGPSSD